MRGRERGVRGRLFHKDSLEECRCSGSPSRAFFVFDLGQTSWEARRANNKIPWVWNGQCAIMALVTRVQFELWVRVCRPLIIVPPISPPHLQQTTQTISLWQAPLHLLGNRGEKWITNEHVWNDHFLFQLELEQMCLNKPRALNNLKYGIFGTWWIWNTPSPSPNYFGARSSPGQIFLSVQPVEWMACARCYTRHLFLWEGCELGESISFF